MKVKIVRSHNATTSRSNIKTDVAVVWVILEVELNVIRYSTLFMQILLIMWPDLDLYLI